MNKIEQYKPSDIVINVRSKKAVLHEVSLIALSKSTNKVIAVGNEAKTLSFRQNRA